MEIENNINEQKIIKPKRKYERKEGAKCGRPKKYETEEQAKSKAREQEPSGVYGEAKAFVDTRSRYSYPNIVGVGDPTLIDISNVNARIAAGQPGQYVPYPKTNYNALINKQSLNLGSNVLPLNQKEERELNIEYGTEKEKELELDKDFQDTGNQIQLSDEALVPPEMETLIFKRKQE
ncbi:MAG: hypothetical protein EZS28_005375 [Streblomastix strix]|uniref:Uncharacterized protein n=1 Tax=Streblomastix strix TaxID=222440 RepID=A0A5J4WVX7_9EUKA|nr:MAG: hypothetical protein EZS28_005375 [Streblomastix strix]